MNIKKLAFFFIIGSTIISAISCTSCSNNNDESTTVVASDTSRKYDYNIVIAPDLSNRINPRIHPKPVSDLELLHYAFQKDNLEQIIDLNSRKTGQNDIYKIDFINRGILNNNSISSDSLKIDLSQFKNGFAERADYIRTNLEGDLIKFRNELSKVYDYSLRHPAGSDIWNYLNEHSHDSFIRQAPIISTEENNVISVKATQNILVILTDGYIEHVNPMPGYSLSKSKVDRIRNEFKNSGQEDLKPLFFRSQSSF